MHVTHAHTHTHTQTHTHTHTPSETHNVKHHVFVFRFLFFCCFVICSLSSWYFASLRRSGVAQWLACWAHNPKVRGSKPRSAIVLHGLVHTSSNIRVCRNASSFVFASVRAFCPSVRRFLRGLSSFVMSLCNGCFARSCVRRLSSESFVVLCLLWVLLHSCAKTVLRTYGCCMP